MGIMIYNNGMVWKFGGGGESAPLRTPVCNFTKCHVTSLALMYEVMGIGRLDFTKI